MHLIVGLGNPGRTYDNTRHNVGFHALDFLAEVNNIRFSDSKWNALVARTTLAGKPVVLAKPLTYMNESGRAIGALAAYYRIHPDNIIVVHDDLDLSLGRLKIVVDRGAGGHNGILSLIAHLHSKKFVRIRFGIGRPEQNVPVKNFVLAKFSGSEQTMVDNEMHAVQNAIHLVLEKGTLFAMSAVNSQK